MRAALSAMVSRLLITMNCISIIIFRAPRRSWLWWSGLRSPKRNGVNGPVQITRSRRACSCRDSLPLAQPVDGPMLNLGDKYYDHEIFTRAEKHCREAGQSDMKLGYADCALPIVLEHNTPNNSVPLLWAETTGNGGAHPMRPLFFRRDRHGSLQ